MDRGNAILEIVDNEKAINDAQKIFRKKFESFKGEKLKTIIGYHGGNFKAEVIWFESPGFWVHFKKSQNKHANGFGIQNPKENRMVPFACQINFPTGGIGRSIGGAFAKDVSGNLYVVHRGKIGGGKHGVGKGLFFEKYRGEFEVMQDGEQQTEVAVVGALDSDRFIRQIFDFVGEVGRIKNLSMPLQTDVPSESPALSQKFKKEFYGKKEYRTSKHIEAECNHGQIVNALANKLSQKGLKTANNRPLDLYIFDNAGNKITHVFEVKTDISTTSLYSAVGQLLLNGMDLASKPPSLILAIPQKPDKLICERIKKLGIKLLIFQQKDEDVIFSTLDSVI